MISVVAATYCGYFFSNNYILRYFVLLDLSNRNFGGSRFIFIVMKLFSIFKNRIAQIRRKRVLLMVLNSNLVGNNTEAETAIRISEELSDYIKKGKFNANALPNGYRHMGV